ncbi:glycosyltransferase [Pseudomonas citronellolis]|uniref:glycosyltransferase n=1 Tax=Pseudomonas citronellolis TaxID=53408 RepID=UPI0009EB1D83|nr:glycosyltransferase [Pseudomonas citronellolis]
MTKFTVLIPLYNGDTPEAFHEALHSVLIDQSLKPDQTLLVIDGPISPALEHAVEQWTDKIEIVRTDKNIGLSNAINFALKYCRNELVFRMDSDDISLPDRFEKQINFFANHPDADMCSSWVQHFDGDMKRYIGDRKVPVTPAENRSYAMTRTPINHVSLAFKKTALLASGGYPDTRLPFEDWWICLRALKNNGNIYNIPEYLVKVRASDSFYERRAGSRYAKMEYQALTQMCGEGILPIRWCLSNLALRLPVRMAPRRTLGLIYEHLIRRFF